MTYPSPLDIAFSLSSARPDPATVRFSFGDGWSGVLVQPVQTLSGAVVVNVIPALSGVLIQPPARLSGAVVQSVDFTGVLAQPAAALAGVLAARRRAMAGVGLRHADLLTSALDLALPAGQARPEALSCWMPWASLAAGQRRLLLRSQDGLPAARLQSLAYRQAQSCQTGLASGWAMAGRLGAYARAVWRQAHGRTRLGSSGWRVASAAKRGARLPWQFPLQRSRAGRLPWAKPDSFNGRRRLAWRRSRWVWPVYRPDLPILPEPLPPDDDWHPTPRAVGFCLGRPFSNNFDLRWRPPCGCAVRSVIVQHTATLATWPSLEPLAFRAARLSYNWGDLAWQASITLVDSPAARAITPSLTGVSEVLLTLDGWQWLLVIDGSSDARRFGALELTVSGKSPSAYLAAPWAETRSRTETEDKTAAQLVNAELADSGFGLDWGVLDWLVPAGAWRYEGKSPAEAMAAVAGAVGAVVVPARASKTVAVKYRHPAPSWDWGNTTPTLSIPADMLLRQAGRFEAATQHNKVYVFGGAVGGDGAGVRRAGTAGDKAAETIIDPLIVSVPVAQERGRQVLSASGNRLIEQNELPLTPAGMQPGLVEPGQIVGMPEGWHGLVTAIS
ncbi:hypothetical protein, partial [Chitinimonas taiwanensis]|uniref:hypothetical protein n=1 Tax=Chitinimonas taiwanensis TaxID=240412 RepID=UPI0035AF3406